jgi:hypothetical protein
MDDESLKIKNFNINDIAVNVKSKKYYVFRINNEYKDKFWEKNPNDQLLEINNYIIKYNKNVKKFTTLRYGKNAQYLIPYDHAEYLKSLDNDDASVEYIEYSLLDNLVLIDVEKLSSNEVHIRSVLVPVVDRNNWYLLSNTFPILEPPKPPNSKQITTLRAMSLKSKGALPSLRLPSLQLPSVQLPLVNGGKQKKKVTKSKDKKKK